MGLEGGEKEEQQEEEEGEQEKCGEHKEEEEEVDCTILFNIFHLHVNKRLYGGNM